MDCSVSKCVISPTPAGTKNIAILSVNQVPTIFMLDFLIHPKWSAAKRINIPITGPGTAMYGDNKTAITSPINENSKMKNNCSIIFTFSLLSRYISLLYHQLKRLQYICLLKMTRNITSRNICEAAKKSPGFERKINARG